MLSKSKKLNAREHLQVLKKGKRFHREQLALIYKETGGDVTRCAVGISKKVYRKAIDRNKIRRKLFEFLHKTYPQFRLGFDFVLLVQHKINIDDRETFSLLFFQVIEPVLEHKV